MSRPLRLEYPGAVWHVTARGDERRDVYRDAHDRERFLAVLGRVVGLFRWKLHAYVLMGNHYHLLLETPEPTLSRGMRHLNGVYTQAFNRRHRRVGHLFQGRFKAILVEKDAHLLELCRYLVLNPVRAGLVGTPREWPWSSYRATLGAVKAPPWLEVAWTLRNFGRGADDAQRRYRAFVAEGMRAGYEPWEQLRGQIYLGSDEFLGDVRGRLKKRPAPEGISRRQLEPRPVAIADAASAFATALGVTCEQLRSRPRTHVKERRVMAWVLRKYALAGLREIGEVLGVGIGQASVLARRGEADSGMAQARMRQVERALLDRK